MSTISIETLPVSFQPTRPSELSIPYQIGYETLILAPKLILSGAGWVAGAAIAGFFTGGLGIFIGAGIGDAVGTFTGCVISLGLEILIRKYVLKDPDLQNIDAIMALAKERLKTALILSIGSLFAGCAFSGGIELAASLSSNHFVQALFTGAFAATFFFAGMTTARAIYTYVYKGRDEKLKIHQKNCINDLLLSACVIFPAQVAFVATAVPLLGSSWLLGTKNAIMKGGASVMLGGVVGLLPYTLIKKSLEKIEKRKSIATETS